MTTRRARIIRAAVVQLCSGPDPTRNLERSAALVREAHRLGASWVLLPENFAFLGSESDKLRYAQAVEGGEFTAPLRALARELGIVVLAGGLPEASADPRRTFNTSVVIGRDGATLAVYRKVHLFDVDVPNGPSLRESSATVAGDDVVVADIDGIRVGLSICYDVRFPELYRALVDRGSTVLTIPAAFTLQTGKDHWEPLLRARAIESQCFVLAPAQHGHHGGERTSWGKSMIVDPWGTVLATVPEQEGVAVATLDFDYLERVRTRLPALTHRRLTVAP